MQSFTLVVAATYLLFLGLFLVGMIGNGRQGNEVRALICRPHLIIPQPSHPLSTHTHTQNAIQVTTQSLPLHEAALGVELLLALLIIWGVRQPLGGPIAAAATVAAGSSSGGGAEASGKGGNGGAMLAWSSPRGAGDRKSKQKKHRVRAYTVVTDLCVCGGGGGGAKGLLLLGDKPIHSFI